MEIENDNEQPQQNQVEQLQDQQQQQSSTSTSTTNSSSSDSSANSNNSSNNSSSSNLLVNLPMMQTSSVDEVDDEQQAMPPPPLPLVVGDGGGGSGNGSSDDNEVAATTTMTRATGGRPTFMSPLLLYNNNESIRPQQQQQSSSSIASTSSSSSSSQSSATSHNLHLYEHEHFPTTRTDLYTSDHHSQQQEHHHSPPPSPQLDALLLSTITTTTTTNNPISVATTTTTPASSLLNIEQNYNNNEGISDVQQQLSGGAELHPTTSSQQQPTPSGVGQFNLPIPIQNSADNISHSSGSGVSINTSNRTASVSTTLPHLSVPPTETYTQQQQQQQQSQLSLPYTNTINPNSNSNIYAQPSSNTLHYQYHQHSHHIHTAAGCSNILAANHENMFGHSDANNSNATATATVAGNVNCSSSTHTVDRLKLLYPNVDESLTPLPRFWSAHDKCLSIGLTQNNLRVHYKGKQNNDAASVRTAHPIPAACGLYYFEVKIVSKGKNGYMGIGLTAQQFRMNRLPGWDKQSYGYHGDDGNSFSSSGNGQSYGPTFTTGDIIGCCVNFVNNTCFYTKNGIDLGIAFRDLPTKLYPTVGLQTPGEEVDANFGQEPFKFDQIEDMMKQMRAEMKTTIYDFPLPADLGDHTALLHKLVSSYLVHNGYTQTIEAFAHSTGQTFREELPSIRSRQKILKLVMSGQMSQAIEFTLRYYPGLLENNKKLWFTLKCRQFIEMINGSDEYFPNKINTQTQTTPPNQTSVIQSTKSYQNGKDAVIKTDNKHNNHNMSMSDGATSNGVNKDTSTDYLNDVEMENNGHGTNGDISKNENNYHNNCENMDEDMDIEMAAHKQAQGVERILEFGKELFQMSQQLEIENRLSEEDRQMLENAFSLIAYLNPWSSPMGWQLCPSKRESVCTALNSAILESLNYAPRPPLNIAVAHANELLKLMAHTSIGACAFVNIEDIFPKN